MGVGVGGDEEENSERKEVPSLHFRLFLRRQANLSFCSRNRYGSMVLAETLELTKLLSVFGGGEVEGGSTSSSLDVASEVMNEKPYLFFLLLPTPLLTFPHHPTTH